uniref:Taurocyamine kinase n=1 Tax=Thoracophelia sp. 1 KU-2021 TaxID=2866647 RepID=A0A8D6RRL9_9ANNE|nr:taurocyamine kinase [Thoracophelia sp. 1 KU-2021]
MAGETNMSHKEFMKNYRSGQSKNYLKYSPKDNYPDYSKHKCMVKRHLTPEMYEKLYTRVTPNGVTLDKVIQNSVCCQNQIIGLLAGDEESYEVFHELFNSVIDEKHGGFGVNDKHPPPDLDASKLVNGKLDEKYVRSCRVRTGRSVRGLCFPSAVCRAERREVEKVITDALSELSGDLAGKYYPLSTMSPEDEKQLIEDHFLFQKPTGHLMVNSTSVRDWPDARGIWHNKDKNFLIWVNEEDHCRVISMQKGGDMQATFERFGRGLQQIEACMKKKGREFMWNERLGYLCACPSNIGTGLRCSAHIQLKNVSKLPNYEDIVKAMGMQPRGTAGEHTEAVDSVYDISNSARLKKSERQFVQDVIDALNKLIEMEKRLEEGKSIDDLIPK